MLRSNRVRGLGRGRQVLAGTAVAVLSVAAVSGARALDEAPAATGELQEIVITAQRRSERPTGRSRSRSAA